MMRSFMLGVFSVTLLLVASATASAQDRPRDQLPADNMQRPMQPVQPGQQPQPGQWYGQPQGAVYQQQPYMTYNNGGMVNQVGYTDGGCNCGGGYQQGGYAMTYGGGNYGNGCCDPCCNNGRHRRARRCCR